MRVSRSALAGIVVGLLGGIVIGLGVAAKIQITPDRWWALAGSALGAVLAVAGSIIAIHYEQGQSETAERRRLAEHIDGILKILREYDDGVAAIPKQYASMREAMRKASFEFNNLQLAVQKVKHSSAEIARAARHLGTGHNDRVSMLATSNQTDEWDAEAQRHVEKVKQQLRDARRELKA